MLGDKKKYLAKKNAVQKKLFTEQEQRKITDPPKTERGLHMMKKTTGVIYEPIPKEGDSRRTYDKEKEYQQRNSKQSKTEDQTPKQNVLSTVKENSEKKKSTGYKLSFNPAEYTPPGATEVNEKHQKKVNKILGR